MNVKEFIKNVAAQTKTCIEKYEQYNELDGKQKKARVDECIAKYIEAALDTIGINFIVKFIIKKLLIENVPIITQCIFDLIAAKVKGITK